MPMRAFILLLATLLISVGCATKESKLVGVWKAEPVKPISSPNLSDVHRLTMLGLVSQNLEIEFNKDGAFKFGAGIGQGTGKYKWEGDTIVMTFNTFAPQQPMKLKMEGDELVEATEFKSDAKLRFKKKK
jgi:hypothetical protein